MMDFFLYIGLPYLAVAVCVAGSIYRFRIDGYSYSALSSQFLENRKLLWGSVPWHIGIGIIGLGHLIPFLFPTFWKSLTAYETFLITVEVLGLAAAMLSAVGLSVLIVRRLTSLRVQSVTSTMDIVILILLLLQIILGMTTAIKYRWGASWSTGTMTPYLWSLVTLSPDHSYIQAMPMIVRLHVVGAWLIVLLIPFSRLVHMFSLPLRYLIRAPQKVVWTNPRRLEYAVEARKVEEGRRYFLRGGVGVMAAGGLLALGLMDKFYDFFQGPRMKRTEQTELGEERLKRLQMTAEEKSLELERLKNDYIPVARLSELKVDEGKYFIDYQMRPALAFRDDQGVPRLVSAKCTHLGCTVGNQVDGEGRILCPCHVSYFNVDNGRPNSGAPATVPLPVLGWVIMNGRGELVASRPPGADADIEGRIDQADLPNLTVYIAREYEEVRT